MPHRAVRGLDPRYTTLEGVAFGQPSHPKQVLRLGSRLQAPNTAPTSTCVLQRVLGEPTLSTLSMSRAHPHVPARAPLLTRAARADGRHLS